jgi:hypothetical protein
MLKDNEEKVGDMVGWNFPNNKTNIIIILNSFQLICIRQSLMAGGSPWNKLIFFGL